MSYKPSEDKFNLRDMNLQDIEDTLRDLLVWGLVIAVVREDSQAAYRLVEKPHGHQSA